MEALKDAGVTGEAGAGGASAEAGGRESDETHQRRLSALPVTVEDAFLLIPTG